MGDQKAEAIPDIVAKHMERDHVHWTTTFDELGCDELDRVEISQAIADHYGFDGFEFAEEDIFAWNMIGDIVGSLEKVGENLAAFQAKMERLKRKPT